MHIKKYGRNVPKDRTYRAHKRNALSHFQTRWHRRLTKPHGIVMPDIDLLRNELRKAMNESGSRFFDKISVRRDSTRFRCVFSDQELVISYDHILKVPVTVWLKKDYDREYNQRRTAKENSEELS